MSIQKVQQIATITDFLTIIQTKDEKLDDYEQKIVQNAGDAIQKVLNYFSEVYKSDNLTRQIEEENEKHEQLEPDIQYLLKDGLAEMETQLREVYNIMSIKKERFVSHLPPIYLNWIFFPV